MSDTVGLCSIQLMRTVYVSRGQGDLLDLTEETWTNWGKPHQTGLLLQSHFFHPFEIRELIASHSHYHQFSPTPQLNDMCKCLNLGKLDPVVSEIHKALERTAALGYVAMEIFNSSIVL